MNVLGFTALGVCYHNSSKVGMAVKVRGWLLALLAMHLLVHPMAHALAICVSTGTPQSVSNPVPADSDAVRPLDNCDLCRVGQSVTTAPNATRVELIHPQWVLVKLQSVSYESLRIEVRLPSRGPPTLL
jgi:hypothetical protein